MKLLLKIHHESPRIHDRIIIIYRIIDYFILFFTNTSVIVTLAEWLTRWPAKPFPFGSAGSSPAGDEFLFYLVFLWY